MKRKTRKNPASAARAASGPLTFLVVGAGGRGFVYADLAKQIPGKAKVVAVAEPRDFHREKMARDD